MTNVVNFDMEDIKHYNKIVFGCPILEKETLEEREFESFFREFSKHLRGKKWHFLALADGVEGNGCLPGRIG